MHPEVATCTVCPRLCRHACPVAVGTGREAAVPTALAGALVDHARGALDASLAVQAITLCTDCGACQDACHLHQPLPEALREARAHLLAPDALPPLPRIPTAEGALVLEAVAGTVRDWVAAQDTPVHAVTCPNRLGLSALETPAFEDRARALRALLSRRRVYTQDGGIARMLERSDVAFEWCLTEHANAVGSCVCAHGDRPPLACCGAAGPLVAHHPDDAARVARAFAARLPPGARLLDQRCARHLTASGCPTAALFESSTGETP